MLLLGEMTNLKIIQKKFLQTKKRQLIFTNTIYVRFTWVGPKWIKQPLILINS